MELGRVLRAMRASCARVQRSDSVAIMVSVVHFLIDRLRALPDAVSGAFIWGLVQAAFARLSTLRATPTAGPGVIEVPFIESRTKVFGLS